MKLDSKNRAVEGSQSDVDSASMICTYKHCKKHYTVFFFVVLHQQKTFVPTLYTHKHISVLQQHTKYLMCIIYSKILAYGGH